MPIECRTVPSTNSQSALLNPGDVHGCNYNFGVKFCWLNFSSACVSGRTSGPACCAWPSWLLGRSEVILTAQKGTSCTGTSTLSLTGTMYNERQRSRVKKTAKKKQKTAVFMWKRKKTNHIHAYIFSGPATPAVYKGVIIDRQPQAYF